MTTETAYFVIDNFGSAVFVNDAGIPRKDLSWINLGFGNIIERQKVLIPLSGGGFNSLCDWRSNDPWSSTNGDGVPLGPIVSYFNLSTMDITFQYNDNTPFPGVHTVLASYFTPEGGLLMTVTYSLPESDFTLLLSNDTTHTVGIEAYSHYKYVDNYLFLSSISNDTSL